ncbi:hypothetical protein TIFTF001_037097, partial [Ficus carica]
TKFL